MKLSIKLFGPSILFVAAAFMVLSEACLAAPWEGADDFSGALTKWNTNYLRIGQPTNGLFAAGGRLNLIRGETSNEYESSGAIIWLGSLPSNTNWIALVDVHLGSSCPTSKEIRAELLAIESLENYTGPNPKFLDVKLANYYGTNWIDTLGKESMTAVGGGTDFTLGISYDCNAKAGTSFYYPSNEPSRMVLLTHVLMSGWTNILMGVYGLSEYYAVAYGEVWFDNFRVNGTASSPPQTGTAQMFESLHDFNGADGSNPFGGVTLLENVIYGTTSGGGN